MSHPLPSSQIVYQIVSRIPRGRVATYGQIAKLAGIRSPRQIGQILHRNQDPQNIPCHRVVFADGSLSPSYAFGGLIAQKQKLETEGIIFDQNGRIDLSRFAFCPDPVHLK